MVIIFKDFNRNPQHVNTIPMEKIDQVKDWLDSVEIPFYEGTLNLQWATIMKTVQADPHAFFEGGGWSFLSTESDSENDEESEEEESAFEMSDSDVAASDESSEDSDEYDENASAEASEEEPSDISEAESWDEQERKAAKKDKESMLDDDEDDKRGKKRKR
jgi:nucleosome binding factor SPN SPT16 subunit